MMRAAALAALLGAAAGATINIAVKDTCDASCKVTGVTIDAPKTAPSPGSFTVTGSGTTSVAIDSSSSAHVEVHLGALKVLDKDVPGCGAQKIDLPLGLGEVDITGPTCPVASGQAVAIKASVTSNSALTAAVSATAEFTQGSDKLVALQIDITPASLDAAAAACSDADTKIWNATGYKSFQDDMTSCGKQCLGNDGCVSGCIAKKDGYSTGCSACFGALGQCTAKNCLTKCISGRTPACAQCVIDAGCNSAFASCSGWTPPP